MITESIKDFAVELIIIGNARTREKRTAPNRYVPAAANHDSVSGIIIGESRFLQWKIPVGFHFGAVASNCETRKRDVRSPVYFDCRRAFEAGPQDENAAGGIAAQYDVVSTFRKHKGAIELRLPRG